MTVVVIPYFLQQKGWEIMIKLNKEELRDKIYACFVGKNIGGTIGGPFEGSRKLNDCEGFTTPKGRALPNDDLDLQLVWLKAMWEHGPHHLDTNILGEYWNVLIGPIWAEYGNAKSNMQTGIAPPVSGQYKNGWKHSNGAWIRTEIWASMFPGDIEKAVEFAFIDACVDHGIGDGTYAAVFVAALQSAAFICKDVRKLIEIGLANIPSDCRFSTYIKKTIECYDNGMDWKDTWKILVDMALDDPELGWFQAPADVSFAIMGLLYGGNDFKKGMLITLNCGDDADCSCGTYGSIMGIMHGMSIIPDDWMEYIGDEIVTKCIDVTKMNTFRYTMPKTCTMLTDMILSIIPTTLHTRPITITDEPTSFSQEDMDRFYEERYNFSEHPEYFFDVKSTLVKARIVFPDGIDIEPFQEKKIKLQLQSRFHIQDTYKIRWILPDGWSVKGKKSYSVNCIPYDLLDKSLPEFEQEYTIIAGENVDARNPIILEVISEGHFEPLLYEFVFMG